MKVICQIYQFKRETFSETSEIAVLKSLCEILQQISHYQKTRQNNSYVIATNVPMISTIAQGKKTSCYMHEGHSLAVTNGYNGDKLD